MTRRERWGLSWRGRLVILLGLLAAGWILVHQVQPFLAPTQRMDCTVLVVEGWVRSFAIEAAVREYRSGHYQMIYTTGGPVSGMGGYSNDFNTSASVGHDLLIQAGMAPDRVRMVPSHVSGRDRTYSSARALREFLQTNGLAVKSLNVLTEDVHARRTRLLFQKALGPDMAVGIIAVPDPDYDPVHWWRYSEGFRDVTGETIAWLYAALVFHPDQEAGR
jgi:uncharacterized SAM-binding protein YcdF (DUF218 family)